jgi:putative membrane protein
MSTLLSDSDRARVESAIAELEAKTALELVVSVVPKSAGYTEWRALGAALWALGTGLLCFGLLPDHQGVVALLVQIPAGLLAFLVLGLPAVGRLVVPESEFEPAVKARAFQVFSESGIHRTRRATGVLLLLSEFEHRAVLLGDEGVHRVVGEAGWQVRADRLIARIRERQTAAGVLELIEDFGATLAEEFPITSDDVNELPNRILRTD